MSRGRAVAARRAHNPEVAGSNPAPATKQRARLVSGLLLEPIDLSDLSYIYDKNRYNRTNAKYATTRPFAEN